MIFNRTAIDGIIEIIPAPFIDHRGSFYRYFDDSIFEKNGINGPWVQENRSISTQKYTLRGLHFLLNPYTDGKLVKCIKGEILDVAVDLRNNSITFGQHILTILSETNFKLLYIPKGFAHGFMTLTDNSEVLYKHDSYYNPSADSGIIWNDINLSIRWPVENPIISEKDKKLMSFNQFIKLYGGLNNESSGITSRNS